MTDVPYGVLLSGGLDSSIIAAVAKKYSKKRVETNDSLDAWWPKLHSFAIGLEGLLTADTEQPEQRTLHEHVANVELPDDDTLRIELAESVQRGLVRHPHDVADADAAESEGENRQYGTLGEPENQRNGHQQDREERLP